MKRYVVFEGSKPPFITRIAEFKTKKEAQEKIKELIKTSNEYRKKNQQMFANKPSYFISVLDESAKRIG